MHRAISRQEKMAFPTPGRVALGLPSPSPRVCTDGRTDGRTLTSQPKFCASIHYQISLAMELRWRALPAGSATNNNFEANNDESLRFIKIFFITRCIVHFVVKKREVSLRETCLSSFNKGTIQKKCACLPSLAAVQLFWNIQRGKQNTLQDKFNW